MAQNREFTTWTGTLAGEPVSVVSTGIAAPSAVIALESFQSRRGYLHPRGHRCGIDLKVRSNDIVIASGAFRHEGTSREYAPIEYPAVPDFGVLTALVDAAKNLKKPWHVGVVHCKDSFYGQHEPERMPVSYELLAKWEACWRLGVLASEMESEALLPPRGAVGPMRLSVQCMEPGERGRGNLIRR